MGDLGDIITGFYDGKPYKHFLKFPPLTQIEVLTGTVHCDFLFLMSTLQLGNISNNPQHWGLKSLRLFKQGRQDSQQL